VRLGAPVGRGLEAHDTEGFFRYLLLGEAPRYQFPGAREAESAAAGGPLARGDGGWYEGTDLTAEERFVRTTHEVLGPLADLRLRNELLSYEQLTGDGTVEEVYYGFDLRLVLNRGTEPYENSELDFVLPPNGFWVQHPFFVAFHASRAFGHSYATPALFTVRSLEGKLYLRAESVRIWHAFGPPEIRLGNRTFVVEKELRTKIW
jgi:hypothetical protein